MNWLANIFNSLTKLSELWLRSWIAFENGHTVASDSKRLLKSLIYILRSIESLEASKRHRGLPKTHSKSNPNIKHMTTKKDLKKCTETAHHASIFKIKKVIPQYNPRSCSFQTQALNNGTYGVYIGTLQGDPKISGQKPGRCHHLLDDSR